METMYTTHTTAERLEAHTGGTPYIVTRGDRAGRGYLEAVRTVNGVIFAMLTDGAAIYMHPGDRVEVSRDGNALEAAGYAVTVYGRAAAHVRTDLMDVDGRGTVERTSCESPYVDILQLGLGVTVADIVEHGGDLNDYVEPDAYARGYRIARIVPPVVGYVEISAGVVLDRHGYIPASQWSRHEIRPGRYAVEYTRQDGRVIEPGESPYYYRVELDAVAGTHTYHGSARTTVSDLGQHVHTITGYAHELKRRDGRGLSVPIELDGVLRRLEILPAVEAAPAA